MTSNDNRTDNNGSKDYSRVDIENSECGQQNLGINTESDLSPQPNDNIPGDEINDVVEQVVEAPVRQSRPFPVINKNTIFWDNIYVEMPITCMNVFVQNLELRLIFPVIMFLAVYHLIAVINFDSYCLDCKPKSAVFGTLNLTLNGHQYYASDVTHCSMCSLVILCTIVCAILVFILWRKYVVTLIYGVITLVLATFCFVIRFYFVGAYFVFVTIVLLTIAALRYTRIIVSDWQPSAVKLYPDYDTNTTTPPPLDSTNL